MKGLSQKAQKLLTDFAQTEGRNSGLAELLPEHVILALLKTADCVTYVPMYKKKEFRRGYNQARELARYVSYSTGVPLVREMLVHKKTQTSQHNLSADERKLAAKSTYSLNPKSKWDKGFKTVILVDDVLTTGSTLNACADILKQAGFERVICASICVTPLQKENEDIKAAQ